MFGKPEWFTRRKYGGWGLTPKTWQGWAYTFLIALPMIAIQALPMGGWTKVTMMGAWALLIIADVVDMMARLKKDERETLHEAVAERNAAWFMVAALVIGIAYDVSSSVAKGTPAINPFMAAALFGGMLVKAGTNLYLERKM
jgi:hypothetical protein